MRDSGYARAANDWYVEPSSCVASLHAVERFDGVVWDPACGGGNIPRTLAGLGVQAHGSDIADRGYGRVGIDFLTTCETPVTHIVSNPPYGVIEPWIEHARRHTTRKVCILARLAFLESQGRAGFFERNQLARVWVSRKRLSMPPGGTAIKAKGGTIAYAWFIFEHGHVGVPTLGWI